MPHNNGFRRRLGRPSTADKTRAMSQAARDRQLSPGGADHIGVAIADGLVVLRLPHRMDTAGLTPDQARQLAAVLVQYADQLAPPAPPEVAPNAPA